MVLNAPLLPQSVDNTIAIAQVTNNNGVIVEIPAYGNIEAGDTLTLFWNNAPTSTFVVGSAQDLPKLFLVPVSSTPVGAYSTYYTVTDSYGNESQSTIVSLNIVVTPLAETYTVTALILTDNAHAGSGQQNSILYTAFGLDGLPAPGLFLLFTPTPTNGVVLSASFGQTNANGQFILTLTSTVVQNVLIRTTPATTPSMDNYTQVTFTQAPPNYQISTVILSDNAAANGIAQNTIQARLIDANTGQGIAGQLLTVSVNGAATYPSLVSTDNSGYVYISLSSQVVGPLTVTINLQSNPAVSTMVTVNFSVSFPVLLGTHTVYLYGNHGLQTFLSPFNIVVNHHYRIVSSRPATQVKNCTGNYNFTISSASCSLHFGRNYTFLGTDLYNIIANASGPGASLTSQRYNYYNSAAAGVTEVQVYDYGPYYPTSADLVSEDDGITGSAVSITSEPFDTAAPEDNGDNDAAFDADGNDAPVDADDGADTKEV